MKTGFRIRKINNKSLPYIINFLSSGHPNHTCYLLGLSNTLYYIITEEDESRDNNHYSSVKPVLSSHTREVYKVFLQQVAVYWYILMEVNFSTTATFGNTLFGCLKQVGSFSEGTANSGLTVNSKLECVISPGFFQQRRTNKYLQILV